MNRDTYFAIALTVGACGIFYIWGFQDGRKKRASSLVPIPADAPSPLDDYENPVRVTMRADMADAVLAALRVHDGEKRLGWFRR